MPCLFLARREEERGLMDREIATDDRRSLLTVTLGFARLEPRARELRPLHRWLDTWRGTGDVAAGMHRPGYDPQLTEDDERGWRAAFYSRGTGHSPPRAPPAPLHPA